MTEYNIQLPIRYYRNGIYNKTILSTNINKFPIYLRISSLPLKQQKNFPSLHVRTINENQSQLSL